MGRHPHKLADQDTDRRSRRKALEREAHQIGTLRTGPCPMKSRSNLESFEIVRISAGSVTTTMSAIPGKYCTFHA